MIRSLSRKQLFNMAYGLGASIVIIGALFKILHWEIGFLTGGLLLAVGLITEAIIFAISAFEPVEEEPDWALVYPELAGETTRKRPVEDPQGMLSKKLDTLLREAKIDGRLMGDLGESIRNFGEAAKQMAPTTEAVHATRRYGEELSQAAIQMETLNTLYKTQLEIAGRQAAINEEMNANSDKLKQQMEELARQLSSLNSVYGGMLSAMNRN